MTNTEPKITVLSIRYDYTHFTYAYISQEGRRRALLRFLKTIVGMGYFGEPATTHIAPKRALNPEELSYYNLSDSKINELSEELRKTMRENREDARRTYNRATREHDRKLAIWEPINRLLSVSEKTIFTSPTVTYPNSPTLT